MKLNKAIAIPAIALAAGISLAACSGIHTSRPYPTNTDTYAHGHCDAEVGTHHTSASTASASTGPSSSTCAYG